MATNIGDEYLSDEDKAKIKGFQDEWSTATAAGDTSAADAAHINAESVRASNGYTSTGDGSQYAAIQQPTMATSTDTASATGDSSGYINDLYEGYTQAQIAEIKSAYDKNSASLDSAEAKIDPTYYASRNATASDTAQAQQAWNEYAAASGLNAGTSGQAMLARNNSYQNAMTSINNSEAEARSDLELQRNQLASQYASDIAYAQATGNASEAEALYNEWVRQDEVTRTQAQEDKEWAYQTQQDTYSQREANAEALASIGDYSGYKDLYGWTDAQVQNAENLYKQSLASKSGSGGSTKAKDDVSNNYKATGEWDGVNVTSVLSLGRGPLSSDKLLELIDSGEVGYTVDANGKYTFYNTGTQGVKTAPDANSKTGTRYITLPGVSL